MMPLPRMKGSPVDQLCPVVMLVPGHYYISISIVMHRMSIEAIGYKCLYATVQTAPSSAKDSIGGGIKKKKNLVEKSHAASNAQSVQ